MNWFFTLVVTWRLHSCFVFTETIMVIRAIICESWNLTVNFSGLNQSSLFVKFTCNVVVETWFVVDDKWIGYPSTATLKHRRDCGSINLVSFNMTAFIASPRFFSRRVREYNHTNSINWMSNIVSECLLGVSLSTLMTWCNETSVRTPSRQWISHFDLVTIASIRQWTNRETSLIVEQISIKCFWPCCNIGHNYLIEF